jgi:hypothetical protein
VVEIHDVKFGAQGRPQAFGRVKGELMEVAPVLFCVRVNFISLSFSSNSASSSHCFDLKRALPVKRPRKKRHARRTDAQAA